MDNLQPNSSDCFVCGLSNNFGLKLRFCQTGPGEVTAETVVDEHFQGYPGVVHGGVVTAMLDEALGRVQMGTDPEASRFLYTARIEVRFRKTVPTGEPVRLVGSIIKERGVSVTAKSALFNSSGELLAEAEGVLIDVPHEVIARADLETAGWRVYGGQENPGG